jgi:tRNA-specific 2-thiouridylase
LGGFTKEQVRAEARRFGLEVAEREESQDFISGGDYTPLFDPSQIHSGEIVDERGRVLGTHEGIVHFTVGQRKGLGIASDKPLYVLRLDAKKNRVVVTDKAGLFASGLEASGLNLLGADALEPGIAVTAKLRQGQKDFEATAWSVEEDATRFRLHFKTPQLAVAPGQFAVMYQGNVVLGGGVIERAMAVGEMPERSAQ